MYTRFAVANSINAQNVCHLGHNHCHFSSCMIISSGRISTYPVNEQSASVSRVECSYLLQVVYDLTWRVSEQQHKSQSHPDPVASASHVAPPAPAFTNTRHSPSEATPSSSQSAATADTLAPLPSASEALTPAQTTYPIAALPHNSHRAVSALSAGRVIAVPTDTLYGLAADANSSAGIQHIYSIKHRQAYAPLAICIADVSDLHRYCHAEHLLEQLLQQLLPGSVTLILQRRQEAPLCAELNPGLDTIGESSWPPVQITCYTSMSATLIIPLLCPLQTMPSMCMRSSVISTYMSYIKAYQAFLHLISTQDRLLEALYTAVLLHLTAAISTLAEAKALHAVQVCAFQIQISSVEYVETMGVPLP